VETDLPTELSKAFREIERLRTALKEVTECYVDKFGGQIQGIKDSVPLHRPCEIARSALKD
jgi:hypothetical protein